ncbi:MAG: hypothetical protein K5871_11630 [Lachnospiraceae bacterium]|nr:hypothetical protein [Lachnospiraceae bacterium]
MKKKMTFRKKGLAVLLCLVMAMSVISGCGDSGGSGTETEEGVLEVPDVDGDEGSFGAISLLVPDDMAVKEGRSESILTLSDEDDEDSNFVIYVTEKEVAREYISSLIDEDFNYDEVEFTLDDVEWTGAAYKRNFAVYAKVDKMIVIVIGQGYKYDEDITLAVLASLKIDSNAEPVSFIGSGVSRGGVFTYGEGLYTVTYSSNLRETDPSSEFGNLVYEGGNPIYVVSLSEWGEAEDRMRDIEHEYDYDLETVTVGGYTGYLYTYEDFWGDITADFFLPLNNRYVNDWGEMVAVYIYTSAPTYEEVVTDDFRQVISSVAVNPEYCTDDARGTSASAAPTPTPTTSVSSYADYWGRGWYGWWIIADGCSDYSDCISYSYDSLATFDVMGDEVHMQVVDEYGELNFDCYLDLYDDGSESGWLIADRGRIRGYNIDYECNDYDFTINPVETSNLLKDYIQFDGIFSDSEGSWVELKGYFRSWGSDFDDFRSLPETSLPIIFGTTRANYIDMYPFNYDDWYVPIMNEPFPGLYAICNN